MARWRWSPSSAASSAAVGSTPAASCGCRLHGSRKRLPPPLARRAARLALALARFSRMLSRARETLLATTREAAPAILCTYVRRNEIATCALNSCMTPRRWMQTCLNIYMYRHPWQQRGASTVLTGVKKNGKRLTEIRAHTLWHSAQQGDCYRYMRRG